MLTRLILIALGGAVGTLARYGVVLLLRDASTRGGFPWGTAVVNVVGCFAIGLLYGLWSDRWPGRDAQLALVLGVLGGFTTFSSFALESHTLLRDGHTGRALLNVLLNNVAGIAAVFAGVALAKR